MMDQSTVNRLRIATEAAEHVQLGLRRRQVDLYDLHDPSQLVNPRVTIDRAEDVRRAIQIQREDHVSQIRHGLQSARDATTQAGLAGDLSPAQARTLSKAIETVTTETQRLEFDLNDAARALQPLSQASLGDRALATTAANSIAEATRLVENAQRSTFRVLQDLPEISRELKQAVDAQDRQHELDLDMPNLSMQRASRATASSGRATPALNHPINTAPPGI